MDGDLIYRQTDDELITAHLSCRFCSGSGVADKVPLADGSLPGCADCQETGLRITWKARAWFLGGHWQVQVFAGRKGMRANLGTLTMDEFDWSEFQQQGLRMVPPMEVEVLDRSPGALAAVLDTPVTFGAERDASLERWEGQPVGPAKWIAGDEGAGEPCPSCGAILPKVGACLVCDEADV